MRIVPRTFLRSPRQVVFIAAAMAFAGAALAIACGQDSGTHLDCVQGNAACLCYGNNTCNGGLSCINNLCVVQGEVDAGSNGGRSGSSSGAGASSGGSSSASGGGSSSSGSASSSSGSGGSSSGRSSGSSGASASGSSNGGGSSSGASSSNSSSSGGGSSSSSGSSGNSSGSSSGGGSSSSSGGPQPWCSGISTSCAKLSQAQCAIATGCSVSGTCGGIVTVDCALNSDLTCGNTPGCEYIAGGCSPSPTYCATVTNKDDCTNRTCTWTVECLGAPANCIGLAQTACTTQPGCAWGTMDAGTGGSCKGTATPCAKLTTCASISGCTDNGVCEGSGGIDCPQYTTASICNMQGGCGWLSDCTGTPPLCTSTYSRITCEMIAGCVWQ